ncbi:unnamed protein product, partial [Prorocentrum cordatum]
GRAAPPCPPEQGAEGARRGRRCPSPVLLTAFGCFLAAVGLVAYARVERQLLAGRPLPRGGQQRNLESPVAEAPVASEDTTPWAADGHALREEAASAARGGEAPLAHGAGEAASAGLAVAATGTTTADPTDTTTGTTSTTFVPLTSATATTETSTVACAAGGVDCTRSRCCTAAGAQCYQKNETAAFCKLECREGPEMTDEEYAIWTCKELGPRTSGPTRPINWTIIRVPDWAEADCSPRGADCLRTRCCSDAGLQCYAKGGGVARCKASCMPGPDLADNDSTSWSCEEVGPRTPGVASADAASAALPEWAADHCAVSGESCSRTRCCSEPGHQCFEKNGGWSACRPECVPGPQPDDRADEDWTCKALGPMSPGTAEVFKIRRGSFFVIGDWGRGEGTSGIAQECQTSIAEAMDKKMAELGDVKFVISLGDSFYSEGVLNKDDPEWDKKWRWVYSVDLRSIPWYSVYGERDYRTDPCACTSDDRECAQVSYDEDDFEHFQMPGTSYFHEYPEMGIELVGLDLNNFQNGDRFEGDGSADEVMFSDCFKTSCAFKCLDNMRTRAEASMKLFHERVANSRQKSMVVFSHYPTDHFRSAPRFLDALRNNSARSITYFGARRQTTDQPGVSIEPNAQWVVGGGGGDGCNSSRQGFAVGEIWGDSSITVTPVDVDF